MNAARMRTLDEIRRGVSPAGSVSIRLASYEEAVERGRCSWRFCEAFPWYVRVAYRPDLVSGRSRYVEHGVCSEHANRIALDLGLTFPEPAP